MTAGFVNSHFTCAACQQPIECRHPTFVVFTSASDASKLEDIGLVRWCGANVFCFCNRDYKLFIASSHCQDHFAMAVSICGPYKFQHANPCRCGRCAEEAKRALAERNR